MLWDDLQLLRSIDAMEQQSSYIGTRHRLLEELARRKGVPWNEEMRAFSIELALANAAGYLTWTDRSSTYTVKFALRAIPTCGRRRSTTSSSPLPVVIEHVAG